MEKPKDINGLVFNYDLYHDYLQSEEWLKLKRERLKIDDYACALCGNRAALDVHHLIYPHRLGTEEISDLLTLCRDCHTLIDGLRKGQAVKANKHFRSRYVCNIRVKELKDFYEAEKELSKMFPERGETFNLALSCVDDPKKHHYYEGFALKDLEYLKHKYSYSEENKKSDLKVELVNWY